MKKLIIAAAISLSCFFGCVAPREYTVISYGQTFEGWEVEAAARNKDSTFKKSKLFLVECPPDSTGARFMYRPGDEVRKYKPKN
jgi:hypothetical protein